MFEEGSKLIILIIWSHTLIGTLTVTGRFQTQLQTVCNDLYYTPWGSAVQQWHRWTHRGECLWQTTRQKGKFSSGWMLPLTDSSSPDGSTEEEKNPATTHRKHSIKEETLGKHRAATKPGREQAEPRTEGWVVYQAGQEQARSTLGTQSGNKSCITTKNNPAERRRQPLLKYCQR